MLEIQVTENKEWCPTSIVLEKIRQEGFDISGLQYLKKMLKCFAKEEQRTSGIASDCEKSLERLWVKWKDDPFLDDLGGKARDVMSQHSQTCDVQYQHATDRGPISLIKSVLEDNEMNFKVLMDSKCDYKLLELMKKRKEILKTIELCKKEYHTCCHNLENTQNPQDGDQCNTSLKLKVAQAKQEYKKALVTEQELRPAFIEVCRNTKSKLIRNELCLFLNKKDVYSLTANWLSKTSVIKSQGGRSNDMVAFLRTYMDQMNSKLFVEDWIKINCEEVIIPTYEEYSLTSDMKTQKAIKESSTEGEKCESEITMHTIY